MRGDVEVQHYHTSDTEKDPSKRNPTFFASLDKKLDDIVAATVLQMWKFIEYRYRNKALYDFRQECLSENFTEIVIRKNRQLVSITHD